MFEEGDAATCFYIILKGSAETVSSNTLAYSSTHEKHGLRKGIGETFGVASLVLGVPTREYSMKAVERSVLLLISEDNFGTYAISRSPAKSALKQL